MDRTPKSVEIAPKTILKQLITDRHASIMLFYPPAMNSINGDFPRYYTQEMMMKDGSLPSSADDDMDQTSLPPLGLLGFISESFGEFLPQYTRFVFGFIACLAARDPRHYPIFQAMFLMLAHCIKPIKRILVEDIAENGTYDEKLVCNHFFACLSSMYREQENASFKASNIFDQLTRFSLQLLLWYDTSNLMALEQNTKIQENASQRRTSCNIYPDNIKQWKKETDNLFREDSIPFY